MPKRIQRRRTKGWRMPPGTVYIGRGSKWGNPFSATDAGRVQAVTRFAVEIAPSLPVGELRGKDLACWCPLVGKDGKPTQCHADILLEIANG